MLTFLAGMARFCLTGDIFDPFVWFELMGVSAYALTVYRPEERGPLQGALNFGVAGALLLAFLALYWRRLPLLRRGFAPGTGLARPIERFRSGVGNDYVTWIVVGIACVGGALAATIR